MIIPVLISFPYFGGAVKKLSGGFKQPSLAFLFVRGDLFDFNRQYYCMTGLICIGMMLTLIRSYTFTKSDLLINTNVFFTFWIILMSISSVIFYNNTIMSMVVGNFLPSGMVASSNKSLFIAIQFCAAMLIGLALEKVVQLVSCISANHTRKFFTTGAVCFLSIILIANGADRVAEETSSLMELNEEFERAISQVSNHVSGRGRILTNSKLGK